MSDARQAIHAAEQAGAQQHAPAELAQARELLSAAERALEAGAYGKARRSAQDAKMHAIAARETAAQQSEQNE